MYEELVRMVKEAGVLGSVLEVLGWDHEVMMPPSAIALRGAQLAVVESLAHKLKTDPRIGELLIAIDRKALTPEEAANMQEIERSYERSVRVPASLVEEKSSLDIQSNEAWKKAREENNFALFLPFLEQEVDVTRCMAGYIDPSADPYQVLLNEFEPDISVTELNVLFAEIKATVVPLVEAISRQPVPDTTILRRRVSEAKQMKYLRSLATAIGYDFTKGRLDTATHPFTGCYGRITTRFSDGWAQAIGSTIHEAGHGKYEHNLPIEHFGTPLGDYRSMGVHESQSRLWENHVGRSREFWLWQYPHLQHAYRPLLDGLPVDEYYRFINVVEPGFIRVNADELTYSMHIVLRFEIEQALIAGTLRAKDVPEAWNRGMQKLLGITPPTDTLGCLQDIHWSSGAFGYFPTYLYGSMISAQLWEAASVEIGHLDEKLAVGDLGVLNEWLREHIHRHGCRFDTKELVLRATGEELNAKAFTGYLNRKFRDLYRLS